MEIQSGSKSANRSGPSVEKTPRAKKVGRSVENACVRRRDIDDGRYELISKKDGRVIGGAHRTGSDRFEANVGREREQFRTMADVIVWASNLVYDGLV